MHDEHRLKDRIDLSLDNRQIFLLFVASAVVVTLVFALGVVVGKRMAPEVAAKAPTDPLALLDQLGKQAQDDDLTFPEKLSKPKVVPAVGAAAAADAGAAGATADAKGVAPVKPVSVKGVKAVAAVSARGKRKPKVGAKAKAESKSKPKSKSKSKSKVQAKSKAQAKVQAKSKSTSKSTSKKKSKSKSKAKKQEKVAGGYTLQLSSFQDKLEAEQYMGKLRSKGLTPHMIPTRIPGRGIWYRVRLGSFTSWDEAVAAKKKFETESQLIAYVARN